MALDSRDSFASIVSFFFCRIGVFNALRVHYAEACFLFPTIAGTNLSDHFFLMPDRVCSLSLLPLRSRFQSRSGRFSISGSHLAAFSIGNRSSTPRVLHKIPHRVQRSRFRLLPGFLKKRSYFLKLFPIDITRGFFAHTRCVELLVSRVLYHFVRVLVKKILNRFSPREKDKLLLFTAALLAER